MKKFSDEAREIQEIAEKRLKNHEKAKDELIKLIKMQQVSDLDLNALYGMKRLGSTCSRDEIPDDLI